MNNKLFVGNLPSVTEEHQLRALFGAEGRQVLSVRIIVDKETGRSRGFGFIEMGTAEEAQKALESLNGREFLGRALVVNIARGEEPRRPPDDDGYGGGRSRRGRRTKRGFSGLF